MSARKFYRCAYNLTTKQVKPWAHALGTPDLIVLAKPGVPVDRIAGGLHKLADYVSRRTDPNENPDAQLIEIDTGTDEPQAQPTKARRNVAAIG